MQNWTACNYEEKEIEPFTLDFSTLDYNIYESKNIIADVRYFYSSSFDGFYQFEIKTTRPMYARYSFFQGYLSDTLVLRTSLKNERSAARVQYQTQWGFQVVGLTETSEDLGQFYPIYNVENGVLVQKAPAPQLDSVNTALARYDNESNGSFVVSGMKVTCVKSENNEQVFSISEGKAHVNGYEVELPHSLRSRFENEIDLMTVHSAPYVFEPNVSGEMTIELNYSPLAEIISVDITAQKTLTLTHGSYSGCLDPIPNQSVLKIVSIKQNTTIYSEGTDFKLTQGQVDWSPSGAEPSPGSSYEITYQYRTQLTPTDVSDSGFKIKGAVVNSMVLVSYKWKMPRYDAITIDREGIIRRIKGLAHPWSPSVPKVLAGQLSLANVYQTWKTAERPEVTNNAIRVVLMSDLENMQKKLADLFYMVAQEQLKNNANASDPAAKKGIFVDPFFDDDMRDQGVTQTGAIVDEQLCLAVDSEVTDLRRDEEIYLLPYELEPGNFSRVENGFLKNQSQ